MQTCFSIKIFKLNRFISLADKTDFQREYLRFGKKYMASLWRDVGTETLAYVVMATLAVPAYTQTEDLGKKPQPGF